ncbi:MAG: AAA family ATPase [archaeon]|nr:AAA family ATPase [archaeon]
MQIGITGTPGVGKTSVSKLLGKAFNFKVFNEKEFALKEGIGEFDVTENELVVPLSKLKAKLNEFLKKEKNIIIEGHMLCEIKVNFDYLVLIKCNPEILEMRLEERGYKAEKIQDNVFCEGIDYCKKHSSRNYEKNKVIVIENRKSIKETIRLIIMEIEKRENE